MHYIRVENEEENKVIKRRLALMLRTFTEAFTVARTIVPVPPCVVLFDVKAKLSQLDDATHLRQI